MLSDNAPGVRQAPEPAQDRAGGWVLIVTAVEAEKEAVLRGMQTADQFDVLAAGVGPAAAAAGTAAALAAAPGKYALVVSAGIGGGFVGRTEVGGLAVASELIAADLGAETPDGFRTVDELGFGSCRVQAEGRLAAAWADALQQAGHSAELGPVLTVTTVTGTAATAEELAKRVPGALAEAMEGYGVAIAAQQQGLPVLEIRAISNPVGPRDRDAWRIGDALKALAGASAVLKEVLSCK
ncbi:futalosine hydrolase [Paenibacillus sp. UNCCL117]|uniref:futalosine hydrolase n=1 Tax=unclassified Paenibacillus TaxID=185978 RepID=UPI00088A51FE|nr:MULTISPECIES: futalosine hydrolase [unclassified Paenibacillus]SDD92964.1 futalosine hydrolase [Paenibacillus sp. cl123]SFW43338.1 futalosine hydrolase [Paenibacillus sp. UNCCL117]